MVLGLATSAVSLTQLSSADRSDQTSSSKKISTTGHSASKVKTDACQLSEDAAVANAIAANKWTRLGGVGYTKIELRCERQSATYQVVKNLLSQKVHSVKRVS